VSPAPIWRGAAPLLLASTSRVRRSLLEAAGIPVEVIPPGVNEREIETELGPGVSSPELACRLAEAKAVAVARRHPDRVVVGADQVVECDGESLGKPGTPEAARRQIGKLAGRSHLLRSAVAVVANGRLHGVRAETARLTMRALDGAAIARYVELAGEAATRSAGGYEIEALGIHLFSTVDGEHSVILGLPLLSTLAMLRELGQLSV
jgi:septum formation protein